MDLEHVVLDARAQDLRREACRQARQRAFLREERKIAREDAETIQMDVAAMKNRTKKDWFPEDYVACVSASRLRLNVGGQIFEMSRSLLSVDPNSLLAALIVEGCPIFTCGGEYALDSTCIAFVDRDWWAFRYVLNFLRDGILPKSSHALLSLYKEAVFWRLQSIQRAIEESHLNLAQVEIDLSSDIKLASFGSLIKKPTCKKKGFWSRRPDWWEPQSIAIACKKPGSDWWMGADWKGARFGPLSTNPEKVVASKEDVKTNADVYAMTSTTWGYFS